MIASVTINDFKGQVLLNDLRQALIGANRMGDAATVLEDEFRLLMKQIITLTPPHGLGQAAREQGEGAVTRDLTKLFTPIDAEMVNVISSKFGAVGVDHWITGKKGNKLHLLWDKIDATGQGVNAFHLTHRDARGRVRGVKRKIKGAWTAAYVISNDVFLAYLNKTLSHVGRRKAGWAESFQIVGGRVQRWISRHLGGHNGRVINNLSSKSNPSITAYNSSPGILGDERIVRDSTRVRREAMTKKIELILSGYSKDVANGIRISNKARKSLASADAE